MPDQETVDIIAPVTEAVIEAPKKRKPLETPKVKAKKIRTASPAKEPAAAEAPAKARRYSEIERSQKVEVIDADLAKGATLRAAVKSAGVSEQTYYQWKRIAKTSQETEQTSHNIAFADLVELEAENQRLRRQLAEKLRRENEELRKRLGLG